MSEVEINNIPDAFQSKLRLMIISALFSGKKSYRELKSLTGATDGNLSTQISNLEQMNYITVEKTFIKKRPNTTCGLTDAGVNSFRDYVEMLQNIISSTELSSS